MSFHNFLYNGVVWFGSHVTSYCYEVSRGGSYLLGAGQIVDLCWGRVVEHEPLELQQVEQRLEVGKS